MKMRRVVTGHSSNGSAVFVSDTVLEGDTNKIWGSDEIPSFPNDGVEPVAPDFFPPLGGCRFVYVTLPPMPDAVSADTDNASGLAEEDYASMGLGDLMEADNPGMHTTNTLDFVYVISGEAWLELDNCEKLLVKAGDTIVQNGTRHRWNNKGREPFVIIGCMVGAARA